MGHISNSHGGDDMNSKRIQLLLAGTTACISLMFFITPTQGASIVIGGNWTDIGTITFISPKPGDSPTTAGTALRNTLDAITDNSGTNPYLIKLGPGIYDIGTTSLQMKPYVDIEGSGEKTTKITGAVTDDGIPPGNATIKGASNAELRFLTVENTGVGLVTAALLNSSASPSILHVIARGSGGNTNFGVYNYSSSPVMTNVTAGGSGGNTSYGVFNQYGSPVMTNVTADASGGLNNNFGVYNNCSSPEMKNGTASASGGTNNCGVQSMSCGTVKINHSVISGATNTIVNGSGVTTRVGNTQLDGGPVSGSGTLTCVGAYDENYLALTTSCQ
jgi:hypothetical protein